jgi:hypothetical protein
MTEEQRKELDEFLANPPPPRPQRKLVTVEVTPRMHAAVKAKPEKVRMSAEDADGNAVIERPAWRPPPEKLIVPDGPQSGNGGSIWTRSGFPNGIASPFRDAVGSGDELVQHKYDIYRLMPGDE